ncbi:MAG: NAD(P)-binding domain-containing protein [Pseudomonadota bacterium]
MILGVAGCGRMGMGMARALATAGFEVHGFDIAPKDAPFMVTRDTFWAETEILFTVVRDAAETDALLFDDQEMARAPKLKHLVICSTLSPRYVTALRDRIPPHITLTDAPMSGAQIAADKARLSFMLGGDDATLDLLQPYFTAMGAHFHRMGAFGSGAAAKVLNNLVAASSVAATRTALDWGDALGLDEDKLLALMATSSGQTWFGSGFDTIEFARDGYADDNSIGILVKDVAAALDASPEGADRELGVALMQTIRELKRR